MVDTQHSEYSNSLATWTLCRDVVAGDDAIKSKKTIYVPALEEQSDTEYANMLNRAVFENYTARTLDGLSGLVFSKQATYEVPTNLEALFNDIDLENKTLTDLAQKAVDEVLTVGRVGLFVDMASIDTTGMTLAEAEALNIRPYIKIYTSEAIINWKYETINNKQTLTMVVLQENKEVWEDEFTSVNQTIYRVLSLTDGIFTVRIFEEVDGKWVITGTVYPAMNGKNLDFIPFVVANPMELTINPAKPPLYDLAKVNLTHFKTNVDYYHGMHFTALPTPYGAGVQMDDDDKIKIGSTAFMMFPDPAAKLDYLEFSGDGLGTLEREKNTLKETMVILGSNMLQADKKVAEAEKTLSMRNAGQNASLVSVADTVSRAITRALQIMSDWLGNTVEVSYKLNTDYDLAKLDPQALKSYIEAWMSGAISQKDLFNNLQKGEIIEETKTYEEYQTEIQEEAPIVTESPIKTPDKTEDKSTLSSIKSMIGL